MPLSDGSFDVVVGFGICYRVADTDTVLQEIALISTLAGYSSMRRPWRSYWPTRFGPSAVAGRRLAAWP